LTKCTKEKNNGVTNNSSHRTMGSQTIGITDLPKEENNKVIQKKGTKERRTIGK